MAKKQSAEALQHVQELFKQADEVYEENPARAHRYAEMAWSMALRHKLRLPVALKRQLCKSCHHFLKAGKNSRFRTRNGKIITTCLDCGAYRRVPYRV